MPHRLQGYAYLSLAMILVGSTVTVSKIIGTALPPFSATAMRFAIAFPLFFLLMQATGTRWPRPVRSDWFILVLQAGAGSIGYSALMILGLKLTSAANASVFIGTLPVVATAIAVLVLGERPGSRLLWPVLLATAGVTVIGFDGSASRGSVLGNLLVSGAVVCEALFILLNKRLKTGVEPLALSTLMSGLGLLLVCFPAAWELRDVGVVPPQALWAVVYYAVVPTVGGYLLWYAGAARASAAEAALFTAIAPLSGLVLSVVLLGEHLGWPQVAGAACVLAAITLPVLNPSPGGKG